MSLGAADSVHDHGVDATKYLPPSLAGVIARPALEQALEEVAAPARWLSAPSGAGKSTLVASHVRHLSGPLIWYRLDDRDNDPRFLFDRWSGHAAKRLGPDSAWPLFSYDDEAAPRRHAARLAGLLAAAGGATIVFDDVQQVTAPPVLASLAALLCSGAPGVRGFACSQQPPGEAFYDALSKRALAVCFKVELALTTRECSALAAQYGLDESEAEQLRAVTGGHAAAAVLACELVRAQRGARGSLQSVATGVHGFLLEQLVQRLSPSQRRILLETSFLPQLRFDLVQRLLPDATEDDLDALADQGLLTRHRSGGQTAYTTHALVQQGARRLARDSEAPAACARALVDAGMHDEAFEVYLDLGRADEAAECLRSAAPALTREHRITHLMRAAERLPAHVLESQPELLFWCGQAALGLDATVSRSWLERAHSGYAARNDAVGMALTAACALIGYATDMQDIHELQTWLGRFSAADAQIVELPAQHRPVLLLGRICEANIGSSALDGQRIESAASELFPLIEVETSWPSLDQQANAARLLFEYLLLFKGEQSAFQHAAGLRSAATRSGASAILRARWWLREARLRRSTADVKAEKECLELAGQISAESGSPKTEVELSLQRMEGLLSSEVARVPSLAQELELVVAASPADRARVGRLVATALLRL